MNKIMITPRSLSKGDHPILDDLVTKGYQLIMPSPGATPSEEDLVQSIPECVGWVAGVEPVSEKVIDAAKHLKVISRNGTGVDNLPMAKIEAEGIAVKRAAGTNARGVAELSLSFMLSSLRHIVHADSGIRKGEWPRKIGREISNCTIGVIGLGAIGQEISKMCLALGAEVIGYDPFIHNCVLDAHENFTRSQDVDEILPRINLITLHAPMNDNGTALLNQERLDKLSNDAIIVNTARAGLVDEKALLSSLNSGKIAYYATDVFHQEPPKRTALLDHPNCIQTSHIGGFTRESVERTTSVTIKNMLEVLKA